MGLTRSLRWRPLSPSEVIRIAVASSSSGSTPTAQTPEAIPAASHCPTSSHVPSRRQEFTETHAGAGTRVVDGDQEIRRRVGEQPRGTDLCALVRDDGGGRDGEDDSGRRISATAAPATSIAATAAAIHRTRAGRRTLEGTALPRRATTRLSNPSGGSTWGATSRRRSATVPRLSSNEWQCGQVAACARSRPRVGSSTCPNANSSARRSNCAQPMGPRALMAPPPPRRRAAS